MGLCLPHYRLQENPSLNALSLTQGVNPSEIFDTIANGLADQGYIILPVALPAELTDDLYQHVKSLQEEKFRRAGIGRENLHHVNDFVRTDEICWLTGEHSSARAYLDWMEELRLGLNRRLFLGLFDYECHFAHYTSGAFYKKHLDAFKGNTNRVVTTVFYLNPNWMVDDGGELVIYSPDDEVIDRVPPNYGKLVVFLSDRFPHEVLPAGRDRYSVAGWFRVNNSLGFTIDPPR